MASESIMSRQQRSGRGKSRSHARNTSRYLNKYPIGEEWGPSGAQIPAEGSKSENLRAALLVNINAEPVTHGPRKKTTPPPSPQGCGNIPRDQDDGHVLVYVHKVQPTDTLAGVLLTYDIEPSALRKANRLWPNDNIQMRSVLYLPVGDCAVKGVSIPNQNIGEKITVTPKECDKIVPSSSASPYRYPEITSDTIPPISEGHHSFIHIDPVGPIEIIWLARPKLSHFPPASTDRILPVPPTHASISPTKLLQPKPSGSNISTDAFERLELVGAAIETFVRRVAAGARTSWVNKTTNDLIELTSQISRRPQTLDSRDTNGFRAQGDDSHRPPIANGRALNKDFEEQPRNRRRKRRVDLTES